MPGKIEPGQSLSCTDAGGMVQCHTPACINYMVILNHHAHIINQHYPSSLFCFEG